MNEECKDLSGQHLLSVMALVPCIKCLALLLSLYPVFCIWLLVKNVFGEIYEFIPSHGTTFTLLLAFCLHEDILTLTKSLMCRSTCMFAVFLLRVF